MNEVRSWNDTPAGLLVNGGWNPADRAAELAAREAERVQARAEFDAKLQADPQWAATRRLQQALADRGWAGNVVTIGSTVIPELQPLHTAAAAAEVRTGTFFEGRPTNDVARDLEEHARQRFEAAQLRQQMANLHRPAAERPPYDLGKSVAGPSGDDEGW